MKVAHRRQNLGYVGLRVDRIRCSPETHGVGVSGTGCGFSGRVDKFVVRRICGGVPCASLWRLHFGVDLAVRGTIPATNKAAMKTVAAVSERVA